MIRVGVFGARDIGMSDAVSLMTGASEA